MSNSVQGDHRDSQSLIHPLAAESAHVHRCYCWLDARRDADLIRVDASGAVSTVVTLDIPSGAYTGDFDILSGLCGYDYTALLSAGSLIDYSWEATISGVDGVNHGGVVVNQSSPLTRSGAALIDFADAGNVLRWGTYDASGYYQLLGAIDLSSPAADGVHLSVEVHGDEITVTLDGEQMATFTSSGSGGHVGLVTSRAAGSFTAMQLTALPASGSPS